MWVYNHREFPLQTGGNVYFKGARAYFEEDGALNLSGADAKPEAVEEGDRVYLRLKVGAELQKTAARLVTTELLGKARISGLAYESADGSPLAIDSDYFGKKRKLASLTAGPFENTGQGDLKIRVW